MRNNFQLSKTPSISEYLTTIHSHNVDDAVHTLYFLLSFFFFGGGEQGEGEALLEAVYLM